MLCNWLLKLQTVCLAIMSGSDFVFMCDLSFAFSVVQVLIIGALRALPRVTSISFRGRLGELEFFRFKFHNYEKTKLQLQDIELDYHRRVWDQYVFK